MRPSKSRGSPYQDLPGLVVCHSKSFQFLFELRQDQDGPATVSPRSRQRRSALISSSSLLAICCTSPCVGGSLPMLLQAGSRAARGRSAPLQASFAKRQNRAAAPQNRSAAVQSAAVARQNRPPGRQNRSAARQDRFAKAQNRSAKAQNDSGKARNGSAQRQNPAAKGKTRASSSARRGIVRRGAEWLVFGGLFRAVRSPPPRRWRIECPAYARHLFRVGHFRDLEFSQWLDASCWIGANRCRSGRCWA